MFYEEIILKIFGCKDFKTYYKKYKELNSDKDDENEGTLYNYWYDFERNIKDYQENIDIRKVNENEYYYINCNLFKDIFNDDTNINTLVEKYNNNCDNELQ